MNKEEEQQFSRRYFIKELPLFFLNLKITKMELENKYIVELRNGRQGIIVDDVISLSPDLTFLPITLYNDSLEFISSREEDKGLDIIKIYKVVEIPSNLTKKTCCIWKKEENF